LGLAIVWLVASTPTTPDFVTDAAGLMAGSIATIGSDHRARSAPTATPVAVLQAATTAFAPCFTRNSTIAHARRSMNSAG
jgi:hypothetical protein